MLSRIIAFTLLISIPAYADNCDPQVIDPSVISDLSKVASRMNMECPNDVNVKDLCAAVQSGVEEPDVNSLALFKYQTLIYKSSCVQDTDSEQTIKAKIQNFWNKYHDQLVCDHHNFNVKPGSLLKLAISNNSSNFIDDALDSWKVSLNHVDAADQRTVLDYIEAEKNRAGENTPLGIALKRYYDRFKSAGAKHKKDL